MRRAAFVILLAAIFPIAIFSQDSTPKSPARIQTQDGGTRQVLESIVIPPMANSPFTATLHTEWVRGGAGNGTITLVNNRRIARNSNGRIYQERWLLVPKNGRDQSLMNAVQFSDPSEHTLYTCWTLTSDKVCRITTYLPTTREDLGHRWLVSIDTVGTRVNTVLKPGVFGNDEEVTLSREFWYSAQLGIDLLSTRSDPRFGTQTFTITDISLAEPDPHLFDIPEGFKVVDQRQTAPAEVN